MDRRGWAWQWCCRGCGHGWETTEGYAPSRCPACGAVLDRDQAAVAQRFVDENGVTLATKPALRGFA